MPCGEEDARRLRLVGERRYPGAPKHEQAMPYVWLRCGAHSVLFQLRPILMPIDDQRAPQREHLIEFRHEYRLCRVATVTIVEACVRIKEDVRFIDRGDRAHPVRSGPPVGCFGNVLEAAGRPVSSCGWNADRGFEDSFLRVRPGCVRRHRNACDGVDHRRRKQAEDEPFEPVEAVEEVFTVHAVFMSPNVRGEARCA